MSKPKFEKDNAVFVKGRPGVYCIATRTYNPITGEWIYHLNDNVSATESALIRAPRSVAVISTRLFDKGDNVLYRGEHPMTGDFHRIYTITDCHWHNLAGWGYTLMCFEDMARYSKHGVPQSQLILANNYKQNKTMVTTDFAYALEALKNGHKVFRRGWNGRGMWLVLISGNPCNACGDDGFGGLLKFYDELDKDMELLPWIGMKTADGKFVPWLASQTDMLATDWCIMGEEKSDAPTDKIPVPENVKFCKSSLYFGIISPNGKMALFVLENIPCTSYIRDELEKIIPGNKAFLVPCKREDLKPGDIGLYSYGYDFNLEIEKVGHYCVILDETQHARWDREMDMLLCRDSMKNTWYKVIFE